MRYKQIVSIFLAAFVCSALPSSAAELNANVTYDVATGTVHTSGNVTDAENGVYMEDINISVYKDGTDGASAADINDIKASVYSAQSDANGAFDISFILPDSLPGGKYNICVSALGEKRKTFLYRADMTNAPDAVTRINGASAADMQQTIRDSLADFGFDAAEFEKYASEIAAGIYNKKPSGGYDVKTYINAYIGEYAVAAVKKGGAELSEMIEKYSSYLGVDSDAEYNAFGTEVKAELAAQIKKNDFSKESFSVFYKKMLFLSRVRKAADYSELQSIVIGGAAQQNISLSKYNALSNDYWKSKAFQYMYKETVETFGDISVKLNNSVEKAANDAKDSAQPGGSGGSSGGGKGSMTLNPTGDNPQKNPSDSIFGDIAGHWAYDTIKQISEKKIINGYSDGSFRPDNNVTRAEFAKMVASAFEIADAVPEGLGDVSAEKWYAGCVGGLEKMGIVSGDNGMFNPDASITRQDAAVIIGKAVSAETEMTSAALGFEDGDSVAEYAKMFVRALSEKKIISGYSDNTFRPTRFITRAEAAVIISRAVTR